MIPKSKCPKCNVELFDAEPIEQPESGMYGSCVYCGELFQFDENLHLIKPASKKDIPLEIKLQASLIKALIKGGVNIAEITKSAYEAAKAAQK